MLRYKDPSRGLEPGLIQQAIIEDHQSDAWFTRGESGIKTDGSDYRRGWCRYDRAEWKYRIAKVWASRYKSYADDQRGMPNRWTSSSPRQDYDRQCASKMLDQILPISN